MLEDWQSVFVALHKMFGFVDEPIAIHSPIAITVSLVVSRLIISIMNQYWRVRCAIQYSLWCNKQGSVSEQSPCIASQAVNRSADASIVIPTIAARNACDAQQKTMQTLSHKSSTSTITGLHARGNTGLWCLWLCVNFLL